MIKNVLQLYEESGRRNPGKRAFSDSEGYVTYEQAINASKAIGSFLATKNKKNSAVAIMIEKSKETLIAFMGTIYSGNFYVPIDTEMPAARVKSVFDTVEPFAVIADEENYEKAREWGFDVEILKYDDLIQMPVDEEQLQNIRRRAIDTDPIYALFTSGSTGVPKGVVVCHRSVIDYADWVCETFEINEKTIFGSQTPFYFSMSVLDIYSTLAGGAELHVIPKKLFAFPVKLLEHMNETKVNTIYWVPTALGIIANMKALDKVPLQYIEKVMFAGEVMPTKHLNAWRRALPNVMYANLFGPTEITDIGVYYVVDRDFADDEVLPIGKACDNVDLLVIDDDGKAVAEGEKGELCVRGSFLAHGYYNNPEKTNEVFVQNPTNPHYPEIIYKTGDLVSINEHGEYIYYGRKDFQIKHRGNRIELGEIEAAVSSIEKIENCACSYDQEKEKIILFYQGKDLDTKEIRAGVERKVSKYMIPNVMICMDEMPLNMNGKIDRKALMAIYMEKYHK